MRSARTNTRTPTLEHRYHTHQGNEFTGACDDGCRSQNDNWNGGDFIASTGLFPSPSDSITVEPNVPNLTCSADDSCIVLDVVTHNRTCGGLRIRDEFQSSVSSCIDEMDPSTESNVMSYGFVHDTMCPQFDTVNGQRARMRCWVDRHEYRSTKKKLDRRL